MIQDQEQIEYCLFMLEKGKKAESLLVVSANLDILRQGLINDMVMLCKQPEG